MKIDVTVSDLACVCPISCAVDRMYQKQCVVDRRFIIFEGNERHPFRLPLSAEIFQFNRALGHKVEPFSFEINATIR